MPRVIKRAIISKKCSMDDYIMLMTGIYETMGSFEVFPLNSIYDYSKREDKIFKYLKPNTGTTSIGYIFGLIRFASFYGLNLRFNALSTAFCSRDDAINFIKKGLEESGSVTILTSYNKHNIALCNNLDPSCSCNNALMKCHFATITGINNDKILISTWGKPAIIDIDELVKSWQSIKAWESTLITFSPSTSREKIKSLLTCYIPFLKGILFAVIRKNLF